MWKRIVQWFEGKLGRCFSCGNVGFHAFRKTLSRYQRFYTAQSGERLVRYRAVLQVDGLCEGCFDARAEKWAQGTDAVFANIFDPEVKATS